MLRAEIQRELEQLVDLHGPSVKMAGATLDTSRTLASAAVAGVMLAAIAAVHWDKGFFAEDQAPRP